MKSHCLSIDTPAHYGWSVVCREKPLFSSLPLPIDLFTGSSYYLKSISATLAQSIFHSSFPYHSVVLVEGIWTSADTCSNNPKKWISILCKGYSTKPTAWVLDCLFFQILHLIVILETLDRVWSLLFHKSISAVYAEKNPFWMCYPLHLTSTLPFTLIYMLFW